MDRLNQDYTVLGRQFFRLVCMFFGSAIGYCIGKGVGKVVGKVVGKRVGKVVGKRVGKVVGICMLCWVSQCEKTICQKV